MLRIARLALALVIVWTLCLFAPARAQSPPADAPDAASGDAAAAAAPEADGEGDAAEMVEPVVPEPSGLALGGRPISYAGGVSSMKGEELLRARHFREAVEAYEATAKTDPDHPIVWNNLGTAYMATGKQLRARRAYSKAIRLDPNFAQAHYNLGAVYDAAKSYDRAIDSYTRALELDPGLRHAWNNPAIVNNGKLAAVYLTLYRRDIGALATKPTPVVRDESAPPTP